MTISVEITPAGPFLGNDSATTFDFDFKAFGTGDVLPVFTSTAGIEDRTLTEGVDYSVVLNADQDGDPGGTVTYPISGSPLASGSPPEKLTLEPNHDFIRSGNLLSGGGYNPLVNSNAMDRNTILATIVKILGERSMKFPVSDTAGLTYELPTETLRANKAIVFDASGNVAVSTDNYVDQAANAAASASAAATSASNAATSASNASTSASNASTSETNAAASAAAAAASAAGMRWHDKVLTSTTGNITLSGEQTIDGVLTSSSRVLVKNQTAPAENGIYVSSSGAWTRATDADTWEELPSLAVAVEQGTTDGDKLYICSSDSGGTLETTAVTFVQFGAGGLNDIVEDLTPQLGGPLDTNSQAINTSRATVASHATTSAIWAAAGNEIDFTGTATLTDLPAAPHAGASRILHCAGACTFTNNANLIVQGAANYTASAGDKIHVHAKTTTVFLIFIEKADGTPVASSSFPVGARAYRATSSQSINTGSTTLVQLNGEDYDPNNIFDSTTNYDVTIPEDGKYAIKASVGLDSVGDGKAVEVYVRINGSTKLQGGILVGGSSGVSLSVPVLGDLDLNTNDLVTLYVNHNHGSALNLAADSARNFLSIQRIA